MHLGHHCSHLNAKPTQHVCVISRIKQTPSLCIFQVPAKTGEITTRNARSRTGSHDCSLQLIRGMNLLVLWQSQMSSNTSKGKAGELRHNKRIDKILSLQDGVNSGVGLADPNCKLLVGLRISHPMWVFIDFHGFPCDEKRHLAGCGRPIHVPVVSVGKHGASIRWRR